MDRDSEKDSAEHMPPAVSLSLLGALIALTVMALEGNVFKHVGEALLTLAGTS